MSVSLLLQQYFGSWEIVLWAGVDPREDCLSGLMRPWASRERSGRAEYEVPLTDEDDAWVSIELGSRCMNI